MKFLEEGEASQKTCSFPSKRKSVLPVVHMSIIPVNNSYIVLHYSHLPAANENGCISNRTVRHFEYDLLYTDIIGLAFILNNVGPYWSEIR